MRRIWMILLLALTLTGCKTIADIKPDTIVDIPLHPTQPATAEATEQITEVTQPPTETEPATEMTEPVHSATQPPKTDTGSASKPTGSKMPSQGNTDRKPAATEPPTDPPTEAPTEAPTAPPAYDPSGYVPAGLDRAVAEQINVQRQAEGFDALRFDDRLCALASVRARETARTWNSIRPDGSPGLTVLAQYGYGYSAAAENLYYGPADASVVMEKWMRDEIRRANILLEAADTIGVGSYTSVDGVTFVAVLLVG